MEYKARKYSQEDEQVHYLLVTLCVNCTEPRDKIRARVERESCGYFRLLYRVLALGVNLMVGNPGCVAVFSTLMGPLFDPDTIIPY